MAGENKVLGVKNRRRGKRVQRNLAKKLGGENLGILGGFDIRLPLFSIEVKSRKRFLGEKFMEQAERNCEKSKTPLVIVHKTNSKYEEDLVIIRLKHFKELSSSEEAPNIVTQICD